MLTVALLNTYALMIGNKSKNRAGNTDELAKMAGASKTSIQKNMKKMTSLIKWAGKSLRDPHGTYVLNK